MLLRALLSAASPAGVRGRLSILIFHRVLRAPDPLFPDELDAARFAAVCGWLKAWFNVLPLADGARRLTAGALPSRALAITFDDGYADNHDVALPILQRHGLPATFFVASGFLDGGRMWNDTLIEAVRGCPHPALALAGTEAAALGELPLKTTGDRQQAIARLIGAAKYLPPDERARWVAAVAQRAGAELPDDLMMRSAQVRALHDAGMTVGAHTVTHPILTRLDDAQARAEVADGRRALEDITRAPVTLFAYPNGKPGSDYDERAVQVVRDLGFEAAVSTAWGACRAGQDPYQLPRFTPWDRGRTRFGLRLLNNLLRT